MLWVLSDVKQTQKRRKEENKQTKLRKTDDRVDINDHIAIYSKYREKERKTKVSSDPARSLVY